MKLSLLTLSNPKTMKGASRGYVTAVLHLAPSDLSGYNVCPMASQECRAMCLNTAGRGGMLPAGTAGLTGDAVVASIKDGNNINSVQAARIRRTKLFMEDRATFFKLLVGDVTRLIQHFVSDRLAIRLNGTSDLRWETYPVSGFPNIMAMFPSVQWYDYTKLPNRRDIPSNYHLTFSASGHNEDVCKDMLAMGRNVAVVFANEFPTKFWGAPVVNGDTTDLRFLDPTGVIVALRAKGLARRQPSKFVYNK